MSAREGLTTYNVGSVRVTKILETVAAFPASNLLPDYDPSQLPSVLDGSSSGSETAGQLTLSIHSWLVRAGAMTVLVDAGIGNGKTRSSKLFDSLNTPWLNRLAATGTRPEDITHVLLTHLHTDHVGWNTMPEGSEWKPTFPNACTLMPQVGYELFSSPEARSRPNYDMFADSVLPVVKAGRVEFVPPDGGEALPGFIFLPTPGHSQDHMSIMLRNGEDEAIFAGDVLHHPVQVACPDWCSVFCEMPEEARRSRLKMLNLAAERSLLWFSSHCPDTSVGKVTRSANDFSWMFI